MKTIKTDLAIVGSGIIGASCAFHALKRGLSVALFDRAMPTSGTSGACDGYVAISSKKPGLTMELAAASKAMYPDVVKELRIDPEYEPTGGMLLCENKALQERVEDHVQACRDFGVEMPFLKTKKMLALEPNLNPNFYGAYHIPIEASVSPYRMALALVDAAVAGGVKTYWNTEPLGFEMDGKRIKSMDTPAGKVVAEQFLFAVGVWSQPLGNMVGIDIPVIPRRGELVVTERCGAPIRRYLQSAKYLVAKANPDEVAKSSDPFMRLGHGFCLEVNAQGQCIIGSSRAFVGYDRRTTPEGIAAIIQEGIRHVPVLAKAQVLRTFAGLRPYVSDGKPIIGRSRFVKNLMVATGHEGDGICLSQITGDLIADLAAGKKPRIDIAAITPDRFGKAKKVAATP
jgi:glycine/D-amino acid oxidase-like deaminating enzyme